MHRLVSVVTCSLVVLCSVWLGTPLARSADAQERVRAKVGIQIRSGEQSSAAKTTTRVKKGDFIRVYVMPEQEAYVYVVHNDGNKTILLNAQDASTKKLAKLVVALPGPSTFYEIDGASAREFVTIICSPDAIPEVATLLNGADMPSQRWLALENTLLEKSKIQLGQQTERPFQLGGNVRDLTGNVPASTKADPFVAQLPIYSGQSFMVKKYEFQVQK